MIRLNKIPSLQKKEKSAQINKPTAQVKALDSDSRRTEDEKILQNTSIAEEVVDVFSV